MNIVINIDDEIARGIIEGINNEPRNIVRSFQATIADAIKSGIPLPKEQRLIILSEDVVKREQTPLSFSCQNWISEVGLSNATVAIIKADKREMNDADS